LNIDSYNKWLWQEYEKTQDIRLLEQYVVSETIPPISDFGNAVKIIRENYRYHTNSTLLIIGSYLTSEWIFGDNELLEILNQMYSYLPEKEKAIVCYLNACQLRFKDEGYLSNPLYQKNLLESLKCKEAFVNNRVFLAELYEKEQSKKMFNEALTNIVKVYSYHDIERMTVEHFVEPQTFINEHILGTHISIVNHEILLNRIGGL